MAFFRISMPKDPDMLAMYAEAPDRTVALRKVEKLTGPLKGAKVETIEKDDIPEGETLF